MGTDRIAISRSGSPNGALTIKAKAPLLVTRKLFVSSKRKPSFCGFRNHAKIGIVHKVAARTKNCMNADARSPVPKHFRRLVVQSQRSGWWTSSIF